MKQLLFNIYKFPESVFDQVRLQFHFFIYLKSNLKRKRTCMSCTLSVIRSDSSLIEKYHYCTCGYLVNELPDEYKNYADDMNKFIKGDLQ